MSRPHYPRQQQMKSEKGGTRWYPAHKTLDTSTPNTSLFPLLSQFLRYGTPNENNILLIWIFAKYLDMGSEECSDASNTKHKRGTMLFDYTHIFFLPAFSLYLLISILPLPPFFYRWKKGKFTFIKIITKTQPNSDFSLPRRQFCFSH